jgi:hypothetical protein
LFMGGSSAFLATVAAMRLCPAGGDLLRGGGA